MDELIFNPTNARKNFYQILKDVNKNHVPITIKSQSKEDDSAVILSAKDWNAIQETLYLSEHGVTDVIKQREHDKTGWTNIDDIDWDKL